LNFNNLQRPDFQPILPGNGAGQRLPTFFERNNNILRVVARSAICKIQALMEI